ncbi:PREDICTED: L-arabinokinase [Erythranthe guttata]|nr:PREDICTED: L-arabinokinase [Erythranthe guttata]|eukprot:XP_012855826.1 PREDICTED: L-arabinokinase [Erythranthe guttata]
MGAEDSVKRPLVFAYYVTGHGFGHATRVVEVLLDCGAVQADALTVDRLASLEKYSETAVVPRDTIMATEVEWLKSINADLVVSDVVPVACRAAADAGIRSVCVTNFSWDFIYAEYVMAAGHHHRSIVWQIAEDYSHCEFLIRLPGYCPMPAFRDAIDVPLVVRRLHKSRDEVRRDLGISEDMKIAILNFGGQPSGWTLKEEYLPEGWICLVCGASESLDLPPNFVKLAKDTYTPDVIAASDCMLGKIGYGTVSEALAYKIPFVFVRRDYFNEEPFLRNMLEFYQGGVEMIRRDLLTGHWRPYLERAISLKPCYESGINGGEVAARILQDTAYGKNYASDKLSGSRRLRDAIVLGYELQRVPGRDLSIPDWYANAENELGLRTGSPTTAILRGDDNFPLPSFPEEFEILDGDILGLSDTVNFLKSLSGLDSVLDSEKGTEKNQLRERKAAAGLFNWEEDIFVTRAPGRLDVMGGIADYSGSLVLQMPTREACHVAIQKICPNKQRLWKHAQARQSAKGQQGPTPVLQIVSYGSELSNRGPTFDMDLSDFMEDDKPLSYEKARSYFARDPSQRWAAYIAGTILVLMKELGVHFDNSISMLVSSAVPEGKGVSSSAAVEVATMSAIAAAHGLNINPRDLALLCQKVENHVVGAPCGVMDQMTSACGEANKLLAMVCQSDHNDPVTVIDSKRNYGIRAATRHPIYENFRVKAFKALLTSSTSDDQFTALGELLYQCHYSYSACGLGSDGTDRLVQLVQEMHHSKLSRSGEGTLYGAKITGGGSGGTVCVVGRNCLRSSEQILQIQKRYKGATGYLPIVFEGSSPGAGKFGHLRIRRRSKD